MLGSHGPGPCRTAHSPVQGAHLPSTARDEHLTFIQLQLGILSPALSTNSVNVNVSSQRASLPYSGKGQKGADYSRLTLRSGLLCRQDVSLQKQVPMLCLLTVCVYYLFLWYLCHANLQVSTGFTEWRNRKEMKTTDLPATKNCLLNNLLLTSLRYQFLAFLAEIFAKLAPLLCKQGVRTKVRGEDMEERAALGTKCPRSI